ncbi:putative ABC transporter permease [Peptoniphilus obesi]|uniref:putative ABC transporter permease n=1 Tax=Peptoniphilus obesi TaxID=1472765 RepID=UPI0004AFCAAA|nr:hypothetical protein [Peptoniphilus obesi]
MSFEVLTDYIFIFFIFSVIGWLIEVSLKSIQFHRFINRGFLVGPYCPIYGLGALLIVMSNEWMGKYDSSNAIIFLNSVLICGFIEYFVSYFLEKFYHARWWDYTNRPMNLHGRIWIGNLILFGLGGLAIVNIFNPLFLSLFHNLDLRYREIIGIFIVILMLSDYVISYFVMKLIKLNVEKSKADNTDDIKNEIKLLVKDKNVLYNRFINAYPDVKYRTDKIKNRIREIEAETKKIRDEIEREILEQRQSIRNDIKPITIIKSEIIESQEKLILLLESGSAPKDQVEKLKEDIESQKELLDKKRKVLKLDRIDNIKIL